MRPRTLVPLLALAAGTLTFSGTAVAGPEDGEGCAGLPEVPATYVCVISVTPENAVPSLGGGGSVSVPVPRVCYVAGCVGPTSVNVPVPGAQPGAGAVAVLWYQGQYIPIAVGEVPNLGPLPVDTDDIGRLLERVGEEVDGATARVDELLDQIREIDWDRVIANVLDRLGEHCIC